MRKRIYKLRVCSVNHSFVFNSPLPFGNVAFRMCWRGISKLVPKYLECDYFNRNGELVSQFVDYGRFATKSPEIERQYDAALEQFYKEAHSPAARKPMETLVKEFFKYSGLPVTSLSHELTMIDMVEPSSSESDYVQFSGLPGQGQVRFNVRLRYYYPRNDWGHLNVDIKDYHSLLSFTKKIIPMEYSYVYGELTEDEYMEFLNLYN